MDARFWGAWAALTGGGAVLTAVVRRRDRTRERPITGTLWSKYASYFFITGGTLAAGILARPYLDALLAALGLGLLWEVWWARGVHEPAGEAPVAPCAAQGRLAADVAAACDVPAAPATPTVRAAPADSGSKAASAPYARVAASVLVALGVAGAMALSRLDPAGNAWAYVWLVVATTDAFSQLFGQGWGRTPLMPRLSKGKTAVGLALGTLTAALVGLVLDPLVGIRGTTSRLTTTRLALALCTTLAASAGDLAESALKRRLGFKDFSRLLGTHGGLMDRYDSLLAAAPVAAVIVWLQAGGPTR